MTKIHIWLTAFILITGCATQPAPGSPEQRMQEVAQEKAIEAKITSTSVSEKPEWFDNPPSSGAAMYAVGEATQKNLTMARRMSLNQAKIALAERFGQHLEGFETTFSATDVNDENPVYANAARTAFRARMVGFQVAKRKTVENNGKVTIYTLLEYPIGEANRLIVGELKKSEADYAQYRTNEAFREMEEMLNSRERN